MNPAVGSSNGRVMACGGVKPNGGNRDTGVIL